MPTPAYMTIIDSDNKILTRDNFTEESVGNIYQDAHKDKAMVQAFAHTMHVPSDPQSGQPTGQRVHGEVCITKIFDRASPLLLKALTKGERLKEIEIQWYRTSKGGDQELYYTTTLEDAAVVKIKDHMPHCQDPGNAHFTHLQDVHFSYRKIVWTHIISGTGAEDDWRTAAAAS
ncbi:Hcp family type VI secretion system effector [Pseudomonas sp. CDFA 602]|uniref:Hcp family type VI secretion system effector n=1 Tax=Pseudomonas californiensis TaxID=2829823 RepID=UPI001E4F381C|nr:Hcp family type VI secretion system effector [Pseudomonas californiensis]MCD5996587.1 Hcp family type VI secretion system effector [Pseudomonas californiensis]MCD6002186.1 Hcp family type VI secretion system effector [Pseudomonas californiensis]